MSNIISEHKGFELEQRPGIGYRVWSIGEDEIQIVVEAEYADSFNPDPENIRYNVFVEVSAARIDDPRKARRMAQDIIDAQEAAELFSKVLNK